MGIGTAIAAGILGLGIRACLKDAEQEDYFQVAPQCTSAEFDQRVACVQREAPDTYAKAERACKHQEEGEERETCITIWIQNAWPRITAGASEYRDYRGF